MYTAQIEFLMSRFIMTKHKVIMLCKKSPNITTEAFHATESPQVACIVSRNKIPFVSTSFVSEKYENYRISESIKYHGHCSASMHHI